MMNALNNIYLIISHCILIGVTATDDQRRSLESYLYPGTNCWVNNNDSPPSSAWHPIYSAGWSKGYCHYTIDCNSPGYDTEVDCCNGAYKGQTSGHCLSQLPNPPTISPTDVGKYLMETVRACILFKY